LKEFGDFGEQMKKITIIRHAKSSWKNHGLLDIDRPLNKRGKRDAPMMGRRLVDRGCDPEIILTSPAERAMRTAEAIAQELEFPWDEIVVEDRLYGADMDDWLEIISQFDDIFEWAMLFGHNPEITDLVNFFSSYYIPNVPTCGIVEIEFPVERWDDIDQAEPTSFDFDYPKKEAPYDDV
jgi:phosphohistidine phosphatase